jgi:hypothetical protein
MNHPQQVTVFAFRIVDAGPEAVSISSFKASREAVVERYRGEVLEGTAEVVLADELDAEGRYRRVATGWGELN